LPFFAHS